MPPSEIDRHWSVYSGGWCIGGLHQIVGAPQLNGWWRWDVLKALALEGGQIATGGAAPTFDQALGQVRAAWDAFLTLAELEARDAGISEPRSSRGNSSWEEA